MKYFLHDLESLFWQFAGKAQLVTSWLVDNYGMVTLVVAFALLLSIFIVSVCNVKLPEHRK